jgi:hypothetical protein
MFQPCRPLSAQPEAEFRTQLARHVDPALLVVLRCSQLPPYEVPADLDERASPIEIAPLKG